MYLRIDERANSAIKASFVRNVKKTGPGKRNPFFHKGKKPCFEKDRKIALKQENLEKKNFLTLSESELIQKTLSASNFASALSGLQLSVKK